MKTDLTICPKCGNYFDILAVNPQLMDFIQGDNWEPRCSECCGGPVWIEGERSEVATVE